MKLFKTTLFTFALISMALLFNACKKDPAVPKATFSYVADGRIVTFNNTSTDASTYAWDFGDGSTSTDKNPVHTYATYGTYTVVLKVVGEGGTATSLPDAITLSKTSTVKLDGTFTDWANIPYANAPEVFGSINKVKVDYDALNIYFLVEGATGPGGPGVTSGLNGFFDVYINSDNNPETGYFSGWYPLGYGADYLVEGDLAILKDAELFKHKTTSAVTAFDFEKVGNVGGNLIKSSGLVTSATGKTIEFSISRAALQNLSTKFTFAVVDVDGAYYYEDGSKSRNYTETWATLGSFPKDNTPEGKMVEVDLTK